MNATAATTEQPGSPVTDLLSVVRRATIFVQNLARSILFYREVLGLVP